MSKLNDNEIKLKSNDQKRKRKHIKRGILGYPKKNRVLYFFNNRNNNDESSNSSSSDDDINYEPSLDHVVSLPSTPVKKIKLTKSKSFTNAIIVSPCSKKESLSTLDENPTNSNWSNGLPYEILLKIFHYVSKGFDGDVKMFEKLGMVCKYWSYVSTDATLWYNLNMSRMFGYQFTNEKTIYTKNSDLTTSPIKSNQQNLIKFENKMHDLIRVSYDHMNRNKFQYIVKLNLSYLCYLTCDLFDDILINCNTNLLNQIDLTHCKRINVTKRDMIFAKCIADRCPNLTCLNLTGLDKQINLNAMTNLFSVLNSNLTSINLSQSILSSNLLNVLFENCNNLEILDISNTIFKGVLNLDLLRDKCPKLKNFQMLKCNPKIKYTTIESVLSSPTGYLNLEELSVAFDEKKFGTDPIFILLIKFCKNSIKLRSLDVRSYRSPLNSFFNVFDLINTDNLERLYFCNSQFSEADSIYFSSAIFEKWHKTLIELDFSWSSISKQSLNLILDCFIRNSHQSKLKYLNLTGTCVDSSIIIKLVKNLSSLKVLNLNSCRSVDRGMKKTLSSEDFEKIM